MAQDLSLVAASAVKDFGEVVQKHYREGVEIEKGVVLTEEKMIKNEQLYQRYCQLFSSYPDLYIDLITPPDSSFELFFYQRIFLRATVRYRYHYCTAPRAFSKSFIAILGFYLKAMFQPGGKFFICAPKKEQGAKIAKEKLNEIFSIWPILEKEYLSYNSGRDYVQLTFRNGSILDVVGALDTTRGGRRQGGLIDEVRDHDGDILNEVVLPLLNVSRRTKVGVVNPNEPHQAQVYITSAGVKSSYSYEKLLECFEMSIIDPNTSFVWGCDYRVPMKHGLIDKQFIQELKMSPTYKEDSFAREYLSVWTGGSDDSWFNYDNLSKYRKLLNPEVRQKAGGPQKHFYLLSTDVGRLSDQTVVSVFRVNIGSARYTISLVNIYVLGRTPKTRTFQQQALDLKKIIAEFDPKEVVIDGNGLGLGLCDEMIHPHIDTDGTYYPAYGSMNDAAYKKIQPKDAVPILYILKATSSLNSKIHGNCYSRISSGTVRFLVKEQEAKTKLLATKVGQKMSVEQRVKRLMPHEMTTKLFEEMSNLRLKRTGSGIDIVLERINSRYPKDKFSSFEYGLWRIKELEDEFYKRKRRRGTNGEKRKLVFFTGG